MCSFDCETAGLKPGDAVHVISLWDTRAEKVAASFLEGTPHHELRALDALEAAPFLVSFNGAAFDFMMLSARLEHTHDKRRAAALALDHYDLMMDFACGSGYFSSLLSFTQGTLNEGKVSTGAEAVQLWKNGEHAKVKEYCEDDARLTGKLYLHGKAYGRLHRRTAAGKKQVWALPQSLFRTVSCAVAERERDPPDVSWMKEPPDVTAGLAWAHNLVS